MKENYYHIIFDEQGFDFTLKNAWIRVDREKDDDYDLGSWEFFLENIDHLTFEPKTIFRLKNAALNIDYLCEVIKNYNNMLALVILEIK